MASERNTSLAQCRIGNKSELFPGIAEGSACQKENTIKTMKEESEIQEKWNKKYRKRKNIEKKVSI